MVIAKLIEHELPEYLIKTTISYLQGRTFQTTIQDTLSTSFKIPAGVPQGSLLAPTLFTYFINDLPKHPNTELALFADDTAIYSHSFKLNKANDYLQRNITEFEKFYNKWKIRVNTDKTKLIHFTKKTKEKNIKQLTFNNDIIKTEKEIKYLGVILDSKLNFNSHINKVTSKATGAITALYPLLNRYSPLKKELKILLYKQCILPILTYACPVWSNTSKSNIEKLQKVQNRCLRMALNKNIRTKIKALHEEAKIQPVKERILDLTQKFFDYNIKQINYTKNIGQWKKENCHFKIKHKLINQILL
mgnify:CR=1 FL=1